MSAGVWTVMRKTAVRRKREEGREHCGWGSWGILQMGETHGGDQPLPGYLMPYWWVPGGPVWLKVLTKKASPQGGLPLLVERGRKTKWGLKPDRLTWEVVLFHVKYHGQRSRSKVWRSKLESPDRCSGLGLWLSPPHALPWWSHSVCGFPEHVNARDTQKIFNADILPYLHINR